MNSSPDFSNMKNYERVREACTHILQTDNKLNEKDTYSSTELFKLAKERFPNYFHQSFSSNTFAQYLSNTVKDIDSSINCLGRKRGYYISTITKDSKTQEDITDLTLTESSSTISEISCNNISNKQTQRRIQKENLLYPVLESWLVAQGYQAEDVSSGRSLGKWGNPDVAGIIALDTFNSLSIELVTIEVKTSLDDWEQWIFEAVSHKRFANRAYFAFAHQEETISKIPQDMRYYAELYGIGVIALSMDNEKYRKLHSGELTAPLESEDLDIIELFSAPYTFVQPKYQLKFCTALGINCLKQLYHWGKGQK